MDIKNSLLAFFNAENHRDWNEYRKYISSDIVWTLKTSDKTKIVRGADNYIDYMKAVYEVCDSTFEVESIYKSEHGTRIVTILKNNCGDLSCDIFDFAAGLIVKEYEFTITE